MTIVEFEEQMLLYVILGIDEYANDRVLAICRNYEDAKKHCIRCLYQTEYYDVWIEKHTLM